MSNIGDAMKTKGYMPLADDGRGAIGFTPKLGGSIVRLEKPVWFDIGQKIKDAEGNVHPITVAAYDTAQYGEYLKKGWKAAAAAEKEEGKGKEEKRKR